MAQKDKKKTTGVVGISLREFARRKGVNLSAIQKGVKNQRVEKLSNGQIDWRTQSLAWEENRNTAYCRNYDESAESLDIVVSKKQDLAMGWIKLHIYLLEIDCRLIATGEVSPKKQLDEIKEMERDGILKPCLDKFLSVKK